MFFPVDVKPAAQRNGTVRGMQSKRGGWRLRLGSGGRDLEADAVGDDSTKVARQVRSPAEDISLMPHNHFAKLPPFESSADYAELCICLPDRRLSLGV